MEIYSCKVLETEVSLGLPLSNTSGGYQDSMTCGHTTTAFASKVTLPLPLLPLKYLSTSLLKEHLVLNLGTTHITQNNLT
jgi:hypothetical protein